MFSQSQDRRKHAQVFSVIAVIVICAVLSLVFSILNYYSKNEEIWNTWVIQVMAVYFVILFLRMMFHLIFSFLWIFFKARIEELSRFPMVSLIIPCFNEEKVVTRSIQSALEIDYPNLEIIVVDDGSTDATFQKAKEASNDRKVRIIQQRNGGKSAALNTGIEQALGEFVLCVDADSIIEPQTIRVGLVHLLKSKKVAAVAGNVKIGNVNNILCSFQHLEYVSGLNFNKLAQSFLGMVTVIPGPVGLFRKEIIQKVGGYRHETFAEDCDLTMRILMQGYSVIYEPRMVSWTEAPEDIMSLISQRYRWTRGILQAIKLNSKWLLFPEMSSIGFKKFFILHYMFFESVVISLMNFSFAFISLFYAINLGLVGFVGFYYIQLTMLDMIIALYCIATERNPIALVLLSTFNRVTYGLGLEIHRFLSMLDEILGLPMKWGKLERKGLKP